MYGTQCRPTGAPEKGRSRRSPGCSAPTESASNPGFKDRNRGERAPEGGVAGVGIALVSRHLHRPRSGAPECVFDLFIPGFPPVTLGYVCDARSAGSKQQTAADSFTMFSRVVHAGDRQAHPPSHKTTAGKWFVSNTAHVLHAHTHRRVRGPCRPRSLARIFHESKDYIVITTAKTET